MGRIDDLDLKILSELSKDASISVPRLSKKININASVVYSRIKRLLKRGLIKKFTIIINDEALGFNVRSLTGINMDSKLRDNVLNELFKIPEVREIAEVTGRFDILVTMTARSLDEIHQLISEKVGHVEGVQKTETFIEMRKTAREIIYPTSISK
ncbi:MAG TPA: Lrp/AsnC family transcriptional regulator [Nitrososphaeraceae archaeon]|jgi:Lrp/AsnC family transcriptional regulator for asnA, asnC and gidA|nr:putative transcriptional regulator, AsnC family [Nitrososphaeraceae archaeon]MCD6037478.1 putative transcriptional regulator, AsnC family [Nitrososphaeraceae archaeon]MDF2768732.1 putative transcriptional regulator, AsnC family [Nitrososphaeraceae archaeon]HKG88862.1 Lrp/AsnC family transcriptional regulator [Nitrososphaeraceae archaeon]HZB17333.1 Lrp/AsnC family transcriptional regulator [Nitrososphaeraceae archaeon]